MPADLDAPFDAQLVRDLVQIHAPESWHRQRGVLRSIAARKGRKKERVSFEGYANYSDVESDFLKRCDQFRQTRKKFPANTDILRIAIEMGFTHPLMEIEDGTL